MCLELLEERRTIRETIEAWDSRSGLVVPFNGHVCYKAMWRAQDRQTKGWVYTFGRRAYSNPLESRLFLPEYTIIRDTETYYLRIGANVLTGIIREPAAAVPYMIPSLNEDLLLTTREGRYLPLNKVYYETGFHAYTRKQDAVVEMNLLKRANSRAKGCWIAVVRVLLGQITAIGKQRLKKSLRPAIVGRTMVIQEAESVWIV